MPPRTILFPLLALFAGVLGLGGTATAAPRIPAVGCPVLALVSLLAGAVLVG
jgi:uncharacterized membrane protein YtjA (UPF0391 family)